MKIRILIALLLFVSILTLAYGLPSAEARPFSNFKWNIDETYHRDGHVQFVVQKSSENFLPIEVKGLNNVTVTLHPTINHDQTGEAKLPRGVDIYFEPDMVTLTDGEIKTVKLVINVDENAPANLYDVQIVGTWKEENNSSGFMGSAIRLHVGHDFGDGKIPVNMLDPPLKFWKYIKNEEGIAVNDVPCRNDYVLIVKHDGSPACVTESTKLKLVDRGWTRIMSANMILHATQQWGYIKDISILNSNYIGVTMSYPTNEAYHELYPDGSNPIVGNCDVQNDSANLSILHLNDIDSDANTITFTKENKIFDGMSCDDAFWDEMTKYGYCGPPSHLTLQREILMSSITDAQNMVDFSLVVPKYLPEGYDIQKIMADGDKKHVTMFISPMPVTNETDMCKFTWSDGGIHLSYVSLPEDAPRFSNDPDRERITINENRGYVKYREIGDRAGTPIPQGSEITWHIPEGNLVLNMYSSLPSEELIKIAESIGELDSKPNIFLDIARIEESRIALNPTDTCAHISLRLLSADKLEQYQSRDKEVRFFEITETDLKELPVLDELIQATHHLEFTTNDDARAEMGLRELVDYEFFIMEKSITKYNDSQDDYFLKLDGNLDEKLADPKPQGFSNEFLSPQIVYDDKVYVLSHTFFWVANEHETQHMSVHLQNSMDNDKKFITFTEKDMESIPKIKQAIEKIGTEFESIHASKGLPENPDWNEYREWFGQKKTEQFNLDETYVPGFVYNDEYYDLGFPIC